MTLLIHIDRYAQIPIQKRWGILKGKKKCFTIIGSVCIIFLMWFYKEERRKMSNGRSSNRVEEVS